MATTYKQLVSNDIVTTRTLLHEAIPITGTIVSGTYDDENIKNYAHGMFQSVYDYPYLSSSANHIFDITVGVGASSNMYSNVTEQKSKKANIYNQMAQVLMGYDSDGNIQRFDQDGNLANGGTKYDDVFFLNFARLLSKDEIKKETFELQLGVAASGSGNTRDLVMVDRVTIADTGASSNFKVNSPAGEYGILYATAGNGTGSPAKGILSNPTGSIAVGLIFYQAGIAAISSSVFLDEADGGILRNGHGSSNFSAGLTKALISSGSTYLTLSTGSNIQVLCDGIRNRIYNVQFNNTIELNSSIYFCRANNNEFNYSSNPTYLSNSQIRVKEKSQDNPLAYITTVGLYNTNRELMAVAKLSEPLKKSPDTEFTIRVRLDY